MVQTNMFMLRFHLVQDSGDRVKTYMIMSILNLDPGYRLFKTFISILARSFGSQCGMTSFWALTSSNDDQSACAVLRQARSCESDIGRLHTNFYWSPVLPSLFPGKSKKQDQCKNNQVYPLSEIQYCPCNKYNAQPVGNWSDCILPEGGRVEGQLAMKIQGDIKECGQGYRYQAMVCYDQDNRLVETSRCNSHGES